MNKWQEWVYLETAPDVTYMSLLKYWCKKSLEMSVKQFINKIKTPNMPCLSKLNWTKKTNNFDI